MVFMRGCKATMKISRYAFTPPIEFYNLSHPFLFGHLQWPKNTPRLFNIGIAHLAQVLLSHQDDAIPLGERQAFSRIYPWHFGGGKKLIRLPQLGDVVWVFTGLFGPATGVDDSFLYGFLH